MSIVRWSLAAGVLLGSAGCSRPASEGVWLEGFGFGWSFFNHRLSHLQVEVLPDAVHASIIGGTSTTSVPRAPLDPTCDPDSCNEFPFVDTADLEVQWARATSTRVAMAPASVELVVGADGATVDGEAVLERPRGDVVAILTGLSLDTAEPLDGDPACYRPEYGWHPRTLSIELGPPELDGDAATVPVTVAFAAGNTLDPDRLCIDEVNERARVRVVVDLLVVAGRDVQTATIGTTAEFPFGGDPLNPEEQIPPAPRPLPWDDAEEALVGWSAVDFAFNPDDADERGAYLRTLALSIGPGEANGTATNYSPGTHLWPFAYAFEGTVSRVDLGTTVERGTVAANLETVDDDDLPVLHILEY